MKLPMLQSLQIPVYLGVVLLDTDYEHIARRRARGDTDASQDVRVAFSPRGISATHKTSRLALEQLASELRSIADSVDRAARRGWPDAADD